MMIKDLLFTELKFIEECGGDVSNLPEDFKRKWDRMGEVSNLDLEDIETMQKLNYLEMSDEEFYSYINKFHNKYYRG